MKVKIGLETALVGVVLVIVAVFIISFQSEKNGYEKKIRELELRLANVKETPDTFFIHDSIPVYKDRVVEVDKTDYKTILADKKLIKELNLKIKEIEAENQTLLSTRDTVYLKPEGDSVFTYRDHWNRFSFELKTRVLDWEVRDSLVTYVSSEYRHHFLWWRWGLKGYQVTNVNFNPKSRIVYNKYIKVK